MSKVRQFLATGVSAALDNARDKRLDNHEDYALKVIHEDLVDGEPDSFPESGYLEQEEGREVFTRGPLLRAFFDLLLESVHLGRLDTALDRLLEQEEGEE